MMNGTKPLRPQEVFGMSAAQFYSGLKDKPVDIITMDSKIYSGKLAGLDKYDIVLDRAGVMTLIAKHSIKVITPAVATKATGNEVK